MNTDHPTIILIMDGSYVVQICLENKNHNMYHSLIMCIYIHVSFITCVHIHTHTLHSQIIIGWSCHKCDFWHNKSSVTTSTSLSWQKMCFVTAKSLSRQNMCLSWHKNVCCDKHTCLSQQTFCRDKHVLSRQTCLSSRQTHFCHDKTVFVATKLLLWPKSYLWQLPPMITNEDHLHVWKGQENKQKNIKKAHKKVLSSALNWWRVGRFCRLAGSEFQTVGAMKLKEHPPTDLKAGLGIFKKPPA